MYLSKLSWEELTYQLSEVLWEC